MTFCATVKKIVCVRNNIVSVSFRQISNMYQEHALTTQLGGASQSRRSIYVPLIPHLKFLWFYNAK